MKLFTKSLLLILALFAVIAVAVSLSSARALYERLSDEYRSRGAAIAQGLVDAGTDTLLNRDLATVQAAVDRFAEMNGVAYVFLTDAHDTIVSHTFVPAVPVEVRAQVASAERGTVFDEMVMTSFEVDGIGEVLQVRAPILAGTAGFVYVGMDLGLIHTTIWRAVMQQQLLFAAIFALATVIAFFFTRRISRPLSQLADYTRELTEREFAVAVGAASSGAQQSSGDEIRQLSNAFEEMEQRLRRYIDDLQRTTAAKERIESELNIARDIQMSLVPRTFPAFPDKSGFDLHASLVPAREVGGDFYDFFFVDERHLCVAIADVSDKGVPASLFMALTRTLMRAIGRDPGMQPVSIMTRLNREISSDNESCMFVTAFCAFIDVHTGMVTYCNAGHNPPFVVAADRVAVLSGANGPALGLSERSAYTAGQLQLADGELLFLYTDGVTEAMNEQQEFFGTERLVQTLGQHRADACSDLLQGVHDAVTDFAHEMAQSDDMTLLAFRRDELADRRTVLSLELTAAEDSWLERVMTAWDAACQSAQLAEQDCFRGRLVLEELVINVQTYGEMPQDAVMRVEVHAVENGLQFELRDGGRPFDPSSLPEPETSAHLSERQPGGLGVHLVRSTTKNFRYRREGAENVVSFRLPFGDKVRER